jgi:type I restriction enzyme S subunit
MRTPAEWERCVLGDYLRVRHGFAFKGEFFGSEPTGKVVLTPGNFHEGGGFKRTPGKEKYYRGEPPDEYILREGHLVVAMTEQVQGLLGSTALIPGGDQYLHNQRIGLVEITAPERLDKYFAYYLFNTPSVRDQIQATATGSKVRHTAPRRIEAVGVSLPSRPTQKRIAAFLMTYDRLISNNVRRVQILEEMARAIYHEWFVEFRYPGHEGALVEDSELGLVPKGWAVRPLGEMVSASRKTLDPRKCPDELFAHFSIPAFDTAGEPIVEVGGGIRSSKFEIRESSVLYAKLNPRIPRVWLAEPYSEYRSIASTEFMVLSPSTSAWSLPLVWAVCSSEEFAGRVIGMAGGTSTSHQRVRPADLLGVRVVDPESRIARLFAEVAGDLLGLAASLRRALSNLRVTRDFLLPRLVSGEVDVSDLDIDAPGLVA